MSLFKKPSRFWVDENGKMSTHEPEREVLISRDDMDSDSDDNDSVLFDKTTIVAARGEGSYKIYKKCPFLWWTISSILLLAFSFLILLYTGYGNQLLFGDKGQGHVSKTADWMVHIQGQGSESCIRLVDVDEDGRDDIIFGMFKTKFFSNVMKQDTVEKMRQLCLSNDVSFPCSGQIVALRGYDGKELWRTDVYMAPFELNCNMDVDADGKLDCIAAGRMGTVVAFNPRNGSVLWNVDQGVVHPTWNFYNVLVMPDFTNDGVPELLLSHGGDPQFKAHDMKRLAGRLILVNGRTGNSLGRVLSMSKYKETYMSPALHTTSDGSQYILYGQGGETVRGDFLGISLPDLYRYVKKLPHSVSVPNTTGSYNSWRSKVKYLNKHGVFVIYRCHLKGVMVSPTLVDMDNDGTNDIVMSAYDGTIRLYNGDTLDIMWTAEFPDFESYSSLAPGYFNDDDTLDFMFHMNKGSWPVYLFSQTIILDGTNGAVLWRLNVSQYEMTSDLVARTTENYRDAFVFQVKGVNYPANKTGTTKKKNHPHSTVKKRGLTEKTVIYKEGDANYTSIAALFNNTDMRELEMQGFPSHKDKATKVGDVSKTSPMDTYEDEYFDPEIDVDYVKSSDSKENVDNIVDDDDEHYPDCNEDMLTYTTQVFLLDRSNVHSPNVLLTLPSVKLYYNVANANNKRQRRTAPSSSEPLCIIMKNDERTTGILGDVDGDGNIDVISIVDGEGEKRNKIGEHDEMAYTLRIVKTNMIDALATKGRYPLKLDVYVSKKMQDVRGIRPIEKMKFRPIEQQPWTQYLGRRGDYIYNKHL